MNLVKGDITSLKGKVVIYSILKPEYSRKRKAGEEDNGPVFQQQPADEELLAWYCSSDAEEIAKMTGNPISAVNEDLTEWKRSLTEKHNGSPPKRIVLLPSVTIQPESIESIMEGEYDVVDSGTHPYRFNCQESIRLDSNKYRMLLEEQVNQVISLQYADIPRNDTYRHVMDGFVKRMVSAVEKSKKSEFDELELALFRFAERSEFESVAVDLSQAIKQDPKDSPCIYAHVNLIHAINNGMMGKAKEYESMIATMNSLKRKS